MYKRISELIKLENGLSGKIEEAYQSKEEVKKRLNNILLKLEDEIENLKNKRDEIHKELMNIIETEESKEQLVNESTNEIADSNVEVKYESNAFKTFTDEDLDALTNDVKPV